MSSLILIFVALKIILILGVLFVIAYAGISIYIATELTKPVPSPLTEDPKVVSSTYEDITLTTSDNFKLKGWLFKNPASTKIIIFVSGANNNRADKAYGMLDIAALTYKEGYSILLFDRRTTGESDGTRSTFGLPEAQDVIAAVKFAEDKGYTRQKVGIIADSLGAISTLMGIDVLKNVGAIVLDSPAARVKPIVEHILLAEQHVPQFLNPGIFTAAKILFNINLDIINPIDTIVRAPETEFLFLHGEKDTVIPIENSRELLAHSNPKSRLVTFPNAAHVQTFKTDPELYKKEVFGFLSSQLGN